MLPSRANNWSVLQKAGRRWGEAEAEHQREISLRYHKRERMSLPRFVVFKANHNSKYLRYRHEEGRGHRFLQFSGEVAVSPYAKFEVERSQTHPGLVSIRSCYCNRYWAREHSRETGRVIIAASEKPDEDTSAWSCTLFQPVFQSSTIVRLRHVQLQLFVRLHPSGVVLPDHLTATPHGSTDGSVYFENMHVIDWETLCILPKYIAFKGDNDQYLRVVRLQNNQFLQFSSTDVGESSAHYEVFHIGEGHVRLKSQANGLFWRRNPSNSYIWADSNGTNNSDQDTLFIPVRVSNNVVALRNLANNQICRRFTVNNNMSHLFSANIDTLTITARLAAEEAVVSRTIYNVDFRLNDARIYNETVRTVVNGRSNPSPIEAEVELRLDYTNSISRTWNANVSLTLGFTWTMTTGVPFIAETSISIGAEITTSYEWGETREHSEAAGTTYRVIIPPMSRVNAWMVATEGTCDVPFSYNQRDTLLTLETVDERKHDGVFTGINSYNFQYGHDILPMTADEVAEELAKQQTLLTTTTGGADDGVTAGGADVTSEGADNG